MAGVRTRISNAVTRIRASLPGSSVTSLATRGDESKFLVEVANPFYSPLQAQMLSPVTSAITVLSERIASLPIIVESRETDGWKRVPFDDDDYSIWDGNWSQNITSNCALRHVVKSLVLYGFAAIEIGHDDISLTELKPLNPQFVERVAENGKWVYSYTLPGFEAELDRADLAWIELDTQFTGEMPVSPLHKIWPILRLGLGALFYGSGYFENGATGKIIYYGDGYNTKMSPGDIKALENNMRKTNSRSLVLPPNVKAQEIGGKSDLLDLPKIDSMVIQSVARTFGIPPVLLGDESRSTYNNSENSMLMFAETTLAGMTSIIESELSDAAYPTGKRRIRFDLRRAIPESRKSRLQGHQIAVFSGIMTQNEARELEGLPRDEDDPYADQLIRTNATPVPVYGNKNEDVKNVDNS